MGAGSSKHHETPGPATPDARRRVDHLDHRVAGLCRDVDACPVAEAPGERLDDLRARLARAIRGPEPGWSDRELQRAVALLGEIDETSLAFSDAVAGEELADLRSARRTASGLQDLPADLAIQRAPAAIAEELDLGRVMISAVHRSVWTPAGSTSATTSACTRTPSTRSS